jgi:dTDP-glucose 4,6-dehydratase
LPRRYDGAPPVSRLDTKIVRIFNTYGPRMRLNDGRAAGVHVQVRATRTSPCSATPQTQLHLHHRSVDGIIRLMLSSENDPVNIGNPVEMTIADRGTIDDRLDEQDRLPSAADRRPEAAKTRHHACTSRWEPKVQPRRAHQNDRILSTKVG